MTEDGYYWCRCRTDEGTTFIALREDGLWYLPGIEQTVEFDQNEVLCRVQRPDN